MYMYIYIYIYIYILLVATLLNQQSAQLNKVKERYIRSICGQQPFHYIRRDLTIKKVESNTIKKVLK